MDPAAPEPASRPETITWEAAITLLQSAVVMRQLLFVLVLATGCVWLFLLGLTLFEDDLDLDARGVEAATSGRTRTKNRIVNTLLLLSGRSAAMGAGRLAHARQTELVQWSDVDSLDANDRTKEIVLRRGRRALMVIQCTDANYSAVLRGARTHLDQRN